jgi:hypothetical protein
MGLIGIEKINNGTPGGRAASVRSHKGLPHSSHNSPVAVRLSNPEGPYDVALRAQREVPQS